MVGKCFLFQSKQRKLSFSRLFSVEISIIKWGNYDSLTYYKKWQNNIKSEKLSIPSFQKTGQCSIQCLGNKKRRADCGCSKRASPIKYNVRPEFKRIDCSTIEISSFSIRILVLIFKRFHLSYSKISKGIAYLVSKNLFYSS